MKRIPDRIPARFACRLAALVAVVWAAAPARPLCRRHLIRGHCHLMPTSRMNLVWGSNHDGSLGSSFRAGQVACQSRARTPRGRTLGR